MAQPKYRMKSADSDWEDVGAQPVMSSPDSGDWQDVAPSANPGMDKWIGSQPTQEGVVKKGWRIANTPTIDLFTRPRRTSDAILNLADIASPLSWIGNPATALLQHTAEKRFPRNDGEQLGSYLDRLSTQYVDPDSPTFAGLAAGTAGAARSTADTIASFTSPLAAVLSLGGKAVQAGNQAQKALNAGKNISRANQALVKAAPWIGRAERGAGAAFVGTGLSDVYDAFFGDEPNPETGQPKNNWDRAAEAAGGAGNALLGGTGIVHSMSASRAQRTAKPIPESGGLTQGEVYSAMRRRGVDMTMADATNSGRFAQDFAENTPGGAGRMYRFRRKQSDQFGKAIEGFKDELDPEGVGKDINERAAMMQEAATMSRDTAHENASNLYRDIDGALQRGSGAPIVDWTPVKAEAARLAEKLSVGEEQLRPNQAISILNEIASGKDDLKWFETAHKDVSRLQKAELSDTLVPGEGESAFRILAKKIKQQMETAAKTQLNDTTVDGMNVQGHGYRKLWDRFQNAQQEWASYLDAYGDKSSPLRQIIGQKEPSKVFDPIFGGDKGSVRAIRQIKKYAPEWLGAVKREFIRRLQDPRGNGIEGGEGKMWNRLLKPSEPFVKELFTPQELKELRSLAMGGKMSNIDVNPSGSGRYQGQTANLMSTVAGTGTALYGMATHDPLVGAGGVALATGMPVASNIGARVNTSRPLVDFLMGFDDSKPATSGAAISTRQKPAAATQNSVTIPDPFKKKGLRGRNVVQGKQAGATVGGGPLGWLLDSIIGSGETATGGKKKTAKIIEKNLNGNLPNTAEEIANLHNANGGATYHLADGDMSGKDAFSVSLYPELQKIVEGDKVTPQQVQEYLSQPEVQAVLKADPRTSVGTWANDGKTYLDVSATVNNLGEAKRLGKTYDQKAIWDLRNGREVNAGGTGAGKLPEGAPAAAARLNDVVDAETFTGHHWSTESGLTELDPSKFNPNGLSSEGKRVKAYPDLAAPMTFLGTDKYANGREQVVLSRPNRYEADLNASRYYDLEKDPEGLIQRAVDMAKQNKAYGDDAVFSYLDKIVRDEGYSGHIDQRGVIRSFDKVGITPKVVPPEWEKLLTPEERASLKTDYKKELFAHTVSKLPEVDEWVNAAKAGEIGRHWYERGNKAFDALVEEAPDYFQEGDRNRFTDFVAATSPQQGVAMNLREALGTWRHWVEGDKRMKIEPRTTDPAKLEKLLKRDLTMSGSKVNNAINALTGKEMFPPVEKSKFFKVPNFARNLRGLMDATTNDSWMGLFSGVGERQMPNPEHYHPISVMTRLAAQHLGWNPAEAQAAIWVFTRTLAEQSGWKLENKANLKPVREALKTLSSDQMKKYADDFADIMRNDGETRSLLKKLGVNLEALDRKLEAIGHPEVTHGIENVPRDRLVGVADRLERARGKEAASEARPVPDEDTSFEPGKLEDEVPTKGGIEEASDLHRAELGNWEAAFRSNLVRDGVIEKAYQQVPWEGLDAKYANAREAASIGTMVADIKRKSPTVETYVNRRNGRTMGVLQIDTYGASKGYPLTVDWLASHPDVILGSVKEKGIGTELLNHAVKRAADLGVGIQLQSANGARTFYEKMGMKPDRHLGDHFVYTPEQVLEMAGKGDVSVRAKSATADYRQTKRRGVPEIMEEAKALHDHIFSFDFVDKQTRKNDAKTTALQQPLLKELHALTSEVVKKGGNMPSRQKALKEAESYMNRAQSWMSKGEYTKAWLDQSSALSRMHQLLKKYTLRW